MRKLIAIIFLIPSCIQGELAPCCITQARETLLNEKKELLEKFSYDPQNLDVLFMLGRTFEWLDEWDARYYYEKITHLEHDPERLYHAHMFLGKFYDKNGEFPLASHHFLKAGDSLPERAEPLVKLAKHYLEKQNHTLAYHFARLAMDLPYPPRDSLPHDYSAYHYIPYDIVGQAAWYVGEYDEGERALRKLLASYSHLGHLKINLNFYLNRKNEIAKAGRFSIGFHQSMSHRPEYDRTKAMKNSFTRIAKESYEKYMQEDFEYSEQPRIPKILHQIWLGSPVPEKEKLLRETWFKHHPDWEYRLWTEKEIDALGLVAKKMFNNAKNYGEKSDIARLEILQRFGGVYVDLDFEFVRPFDILHHSLDFYVGLETEKFVGNAVIGAVPHHPIIERAVEDLTLDEGSLHTKEGWKGTVELTGPIFFSYCIEEEIHNPASGRAVIFPVTYFFPWRPNSNAERVNSTPKDVVKNIKPETFAIHHWHSSWCDL